jgi:hypothetical protein
VAVPAPYKRYKIPAPSLKTVSSFLALFEAIKTSEEVLVKVVTVA